MLTSYLITGLPIPFENKELGRIYQPTVKEIVSNDLTPTKIVQPFLISLDLLEVAEDVKFELKNFDLYFLPNMMIGERHALEVLAVILQLLYKTDKVSLLLQEQKILIDDTIAIHRENFDELTDMVLEMFMQERPKEREKEPEFTNPIQKKIYEKMQKNREREAKKNAMHLPDIINVVCHINGFTPYREVIDLTYYQLLTSYTTLLGIDSYKEFCLYKISPKFDIKDDVKHWIKNTKITKADLN